MAVALTHGNEKTNEENKYVTDEIMALFIT
jgi:hypothetical protein